ncbi:MAG: glycosyltransferase family 10 [Verrucomicrobiota bacterium]|nr:glycosyltransferase family 10 [Verrucomicrobiota bacterium]
MMPAIKLNFSDFWPGFDKRDNYFVRLLSPRYDLAIGEQPDYLIYSTFGTEYRKHRGIRIFYTGECIEPDWDECDYSFDFEFTDRPGHYRLPHYALYGDPAELIQPPGFDPARVLAEKTKFCCFVVSNPRGKERIEFFHKLSQYKTVDSGGRFLNNVGGPVDDKLAFMRAHKFAIAFENQSHPGYTTEKLFQAMQAHCVPIYWGNPLVERDFNPRSFVNATDFDGPDALVERVAKVDQDDALYLEYLRQPCYVGNRVNEYIKPENVLAQFARIFEGPAEPIAGKDRFRRTARRLLKQMRRAYWTRRSQQIRRALVRNPLIRRLLVMRHRVLEKREGENAEC